MKACKKILLINSRIARKNDSASWNMLDYIGCGFHANKQVQKPFNLLISKMKPQCQQSHKSVKMPMFRLMLKKQVVFYNKTSNLIFLNQKYCVKLWPVHRKSPISHLKTQKSAKIINSIVNTNGEGKIFWSRGSSIASVC